MHKRHKITTSRNLKSSNRVQSCVRKKHEWKGMITSIRVYCYICSTPQYLLIYFLCNNEVSTAQTYNIQGKVIPNAEKANILRKVILVHFNILSLHSPEETEDATRNRRLPASPTYTHTKKIRKIRTSIHRYTHIHSHVT